MKKRVCILGSTGSIGKNALRVIESMPGLCEVTALTANQNLALFKRQIAFWKPREAAVQDDKTYRELKAGGDLGNVKILSGVKGIEETASSEDVDIIICAISGSAALTPLLEAIKSRKIIGLASKEPIVMTGRLLVEEAGKSGADIIPVDSEPNAIFQCVNKREKIEQIANLIITASGGPFRALSKESLKNVSPRQALSHPAWHMGRKISVDSATMMNKGLEVIEAHNLFGIPFGNIKVVIHPQAKIHSMVEFIDGNIMAVMSQTDMRIPIQYAITYPERFPTALKPLNLVETGQLTFESPDTNKFPGLDHCYEAGKTGGTMPAVLNAANEIAVDRFLKGNIRFTDIPDICIEAMNSHEPSPIESVEQILDIDTTAREHAKQIVKKWNSHKHS